MKAATTVALVLATLLSASVLAAPHPIAQGKYRVNALVPRQARCTIAFWDWWRNPNNCELVYPGYPGQPTVNPTPTTSTRSTTTTRSTSTTTTRSTTTTTRSTTTTTSSSTTTTASASTTTTTTPVATTTTSGTPVATIPPSTTTTTIAPTVVPTGSLTAAQQSALTSSNQYRALHGAQPFAWDASLATSAQAAADTCVFQHTAGDYGENLAAGSGALTYPGAIDLWYQEISQYNFANPGFSQDTGHFTQLVWAASNLVGCGINTQCTPQQLGFGSGFGTQATFVVCQYRPPGNFIGEFAQNVLPLL
ncbi:hypothetical protein A4X09_0g3571 [Tilletia walkeri]|uniref:SCP domain-containing protein n=1 Tax=Tilletia walkeri TaxID=117179 RepID=A0A8X7N8N5_9BASI|nr:hypothetical protein A4X09_0g3571 [Tilletia walkeri]